MFLEGSKQETIDLRWIKQVEVFLQIKTSLGIVGTGSTSQGKSGADHPGFPWPLTQGYTLAVPVEGLAFLRKEGGRRNDRFSLTCHFYQENCKLSLKSPGDLHLGPCPEPCPCHKGGHSESFRPEREGRVLGRCLSLFHHPTENICHRSGTRTVITAMFQKLDLNIYNENTLYTLPTGYSPGTSSRPFKCFSFKYRQSILTRYLRKASSVRQGPWQTLQGKELRGNRGKARSRNKTVQKKNHNFLRAIEDTQLWNNRKQQQKTFWGEQSAAKK